MTTQGQGTTRDEDELALGPMQRACRQPELVVAWQEPPSIALELRPRSRM